MMVRNEEALLPLALRSALGLADELIIVDTGSTDATLQIAREFGATVITGADRRHKAESRNAGIAAATGDWIVILDADEEIQEPQAIRRYLATTAADAVYIRETFMDGTTPTLSFAQQRIWRRGAYLYKYRAHEVPLPVNGWGKLAYSDFVWEHRPPASGREWKREHMLLLLLMDVDEQPGDPRPMYYLARELMYLGAHGPAIEWSRRYLAAAPRGDSDKVEAWGVMATCFFQTGRRKEGLECLYQAMAEQPGRRDWPCLLAEQYHANGEHAVAIGLLKQALEYGRPEVGYINEFWFGPGIYDLLARCLWYAGRQAEGLPYAQQAVALAPDNAHYRVNLKFFEDYHAAHQPPG
jgi:tetratricopeptide (TPR) repeat protein